MIRRLLGRLWPFCALHDLDEPWCRFEPRRVAVEDRVAMLRRAGGI